MSISMGKSHQNIHQLDKFSSQGKTVFRVMKRVYRIYIDLFTWDEGLLVDMNMDIHPQALFLASVNEKKRDVKSSQPKFSNWMTGSDGTAS